MSQNPKTESVVLNLVSFRKEFFPLAPEDLALLKSRQVSVARITESALMILSKTLLKGLKVKVHPWVEVYKEMLETFQASFKEGFDFDAEDNWLLIRSEGTEADSIKTIENRVALLSKYCGRYGFRVNHLTKNRKTFTLTRLLFIPDRNLVPSMFFNVSESLEDPIEWKFHLSRACRVVMTKKKSPANIPCLKVVFEDLSGTQFTESFSRAFNFSEIQAKDCEAALNFFATLLSYTKK